MTTHTTTIEREGSGDNGRFVLKVDGREAGELTFVSDGPGTVVADHTFVEAPMRGKGHARALVAALVEWARAGEKKIVPSCWYVREVMTSEPELRSLLAH